MIISVTKLIALAGHNPYFQAIDAFYALRRRKYSNSSVRQILAKHPMAKRFTSVARITPKLKQDARRIINIVCKEQKVNFCRPYGFFARHRGRVFEHKAVAKIAQVFKPNDLKLQVPTQFHAHGFTIRGKADCLLEGEVVIEIKCRMYRFMKAKSFELDQLSLYCTSLQKPGLLIQYFDEQLHVTKLSLQEAEERTHKLLEDAEWLFGSIRRREGFPSSTLPKRPGAFERRYSSHLVQELRRQSS